MASVLNKRSVTILKVIQPNHYVIKELAESHIQSSAKLFDELEAHYLNKYDLIDVIPRVVTIPIKGSLVLVKPEDESLWYRGKVEGILETCKGARASIYLVDYGKLVIARKEWIRDMPAKAKSIPFQAINFFLSNIQPCSMIFNEDLKVSRKPTEMWDISAVEETKEIIKVLETAEIIVECFHPEGTYYGQLIVNYKGTNVNINNYLQEKNYACGFIHEDNSDEDTKAMMLDDRVCNWIDSSTIHYGNQVLQLQSPLSGRHSRTSTHSRNRTNLSPQQQQQQYDEEKSKEKKFDSPLGNETPRRQGMGRGQLILELAAQKNLRHIRSGRHKVPNIENLCLSSVRMNSVTDSDSSTLSLSFSSQDTETVAAYSPPSLKSSLGSQLFSSPSHITRVPLKSDIPGLDISPSLVSVNNCSIKQSGISKSQEKERTSCVCDSPRVTASRTRSLSSCSQASKAFLGKTLKSNLSLLLPRSPASQVSQGKTLKSNINLLSPSSRASHRKTLKSNLSSLVHANTLVSEKSLPSQSVKNNRRVNVRNGFSSQSLPQETSLPSVCQQFETVTTANGVKCDLRQRFEKFSSDKAAVHDESQLSNIMHNDTKMFLGNSSSTILKLGSLIPQPVQSFASSLLPDTLIEVLERSHMPGPSTTQSNAWPAVLRGRSVAIIAPKKSGKTLACLLPLLSVLVHPQIYQSLGKCTGPLVLILCTTWSNCQTLYTQCVELLPEIYQKNVTCMYGGSGTENEKFTLVGCDILITTPSYYLHLQEEKNFQMNRCCHIMLDEADILTECFTKEIMQIMFSYVSERKKHRLKSLPNQVLLCSSTCTPGVKSFIHKMMLDPIVLISSFLEAAVYAQVPVFIKMTKTSGLSCTLVDLLQNGSKQKTVVCTTSYLVAVEVAKILNSCAIYTLLAHEELEHYVLKNVKCEWEEPACSAVLVVSDVVLPEIKITGAEWLIHYDLPSSSRLVFGYRFVSLVNNLQMKLQVTGDQRDSLIKDSLCHILLTPDCEVQSIDLINFLSRLGREAPKQLQELAHKKQLRRNLCPSLQAFGTCNFSNWCTFRHVVDKASDQPSSDLPHWGQAKIHVTHVLDASHFFGRLGEYRDPVTGILKNDQSTYLNLQLQLTMHFCQAKNRTVHESPKVGDICAIKKPGDAYHRVKVLEVDNPILEFMLKKAVVFFLDMGWTEKVEASNLLSLPANLEPIPPQAIQIYACGVEPIDGHQQWTPQAGSCVCQNIAGKDITGNVVLCLKNCIFLDHIVVRVQMLNSTYMNTFNHNQELVKLNFAIPNSTHISSLKKACQGVIEWHEPKNEVLGLDVPNMPSNEKESTGKKSAEPVHLTRSVSLDDVSENEADCESSPISTPEPEEAKNFLSLVALKMFGNDSGILVETSDDESTRLEVKKPLKKSRENKLPSPVKPSIPSVVLPSDMPPLENIPNFVPSLVPKVQWFQNESELIIIILLDTYQEYEFYATTSSIYIKVHRLGQLFTFEETLYNSIVAESSQSIPLGRLLKLKLCKVQNKHWPRLIKKSEKVRHITVHPDHLVTTSCDESTSVRTHSFNRNACEVQRTNLHFDPRNMDDFDGNTESDTDWEINHHNATSMFS